MLDILIKIAGFTGIVSLPFTLYFASKRIGYKIAARYTSGVRRLTAKGIRAVTLMNLKDRPVAIFEIHAVVNGRSLQLKKFDPPFILKNLESTNIEIEPVSFYSTDEGDFEWKDPTAKNERVDFYLSTVDKNIKCIRKGPASHYQVMQKKKLKLISAHTKHYNGHIINDEARYAVVYKDNGKDKTAFIDRHGIMHNWDYLPNALHIDDLKDRDTVRAAIMRSGLEPLVKPFVIEDLDKQRE